MIRLEKILLSNNNKRLTYHFQCPGVESYFKRKRSFFIEYEEDISTCPASILTVPFLANMAPIAWFLDADLYVPTIDSTFLKSINTIKALFLHHHPNRNFQSNIIYDKIETIYSENPLKTALLFSGGVDAFTSFIRHAKESPRLILYHGADIPLRDTLQWKSCQSYFQRLDPIATLPCSIVKTDFREFYTYHLHALVSADWWALVQHGLALTASLAPLAHLHGLGKIYIASSDTDFAWGSTPETDSAIRWASTQVINDGSELSRAEKVGLIVETYRDLPAKPLLRVCYSDAKESLNCGVCEKCLRTAVTLALHGANPMDYGIPLPDKPFQYLFEAFQHGRFASNPSNLRLWKQIENLAAQAKPLNFIIPESDRYYLRKLAQKELSQFIQLSIERKRTEKGTPYINFKTKVALQFPLAFSVYLGLRRRLSRHLTHHSNRNRLQ
ncbi:hypothetical protein [Geothrix paludis]|uniref:hypothetical protein n=1 Tax=Geothrix paludis TaxID=2922722 RepID=UPI001FABB31E|nr:hypothetical protein [Geothrix paludis]